ncbi:MAG: nucleotidyltransferase family protein [Clostridia bacterium]|nr:nucleotidyltransferase family protein [Clostridia bacterium]
MNTKDLLLSLVRSAVMKEAVSDEAKESLKSGSVATLFKVAKAHDMAHLVAHMLSEGDVPSDLWLSFQKEKEKAIARYEMMKADMEGIFSCFEEERIDYIPLKGAVVRQLYIEPWMRTSCDIDILVCEQDLERAVSALVNSCSYKTDGKKAFHDISLFSPFGMHLELHHNIKEDNDRYDKLLTRVWEFSKKESENGHKYLQSNEFLMFHLIAHAAYHFVGGGCGLRTVLDVWLLHKKLEIDEEKLNELLEETGLTKFYSAMVRLGEHWFGHETSKDKDILEMEMYILLGGVYGTKKQGAGAKQVKKGGKFKYFWSRIFMPYKNLVILYPIIKKHRILTPFCQIARWFSVIFKGKRIAREIKTVASTGTEETNQIRELLESLNL